MMGYWVWWLWSEVMMKILHLYFEGILTPLWRCVYAGEWWVNLFARQFIFVGIERFLSDKSFILPWKLFWDDLKRGQRARPSLLFTFYCSFEDDSTLTTVRSIQIIGKPSTPSCQLVNWLKKDARNDHHVINFCWCPSLYQRSCPDGN